MGTRDSRGHLRVERHLILVLPEVLGEIGRTKVALEVRHYELFGRSSER